MKINLVCSLFVLDSEKNINIRKNNIEKLKILVDKDKLIPVITYTSGNIKEEVRKFISDIIGSNTFHLEQVFTINTDNSVDILYLAVTNRENVINLKDNYCLIDFGIEDNKAIIYDKNIYLYQTKEIIENNNIEYIHEVDIEDKILKNNLINVLICYKKIRVNINDTDILFKFMGSSFTLEEVRLLYELIKNTKVDKSNFRKKIVKYCEEVTSEREENNGYRPSQKYRFKPLKGDIWL